jgi:hypothetical protein
MVAELVRWFRTRPFDQQLMIGAALSDVSGAALGYLVHQQVGLSLVEGLVTGILVANVPFMLWFMRAV